MRRIIGWLMVLSFAAPALAGVTITCSVNGNDVTVGYDSTGEPELVRIFTLDITVDSGAKITAVSNISSDYYVHPGSIVVDPQTGEVSSYGSPVADPVVYPTGTLGGLGTSGITIEMGSLYAASDPGHPTPPPATSDLLTFSVNRPCCVTITENTARGGVVLEDPAVASNPVFPNQTECCTCTCLGDMTGDGWVSPSDLSDVVSKLLPHKSNAYWAPASEGACGDMNQDGWLSPNDLTAIVNMLLPEKSNTYWLRCE